MPTSSTASSAVPSNIGRAAYRIVQEGLTNARKHAADLPVQVLLDGRAGTELVVEIRNPMPKDSLPSSAASSVGVGLVGLAERAQLVGGKLESGQAGGEFRIRATLPWPK